MILALNATLAAVEALKSVATDELNVVFPLATLALNDVICALLADVEVANELLTELTLALTDVIEATLALNEVAKDELLLVIAFD